VTGIVLLASLAPRVEAQGLPSGFPDAAKDLWGELHDVVAEGTSAFVAPETCDLRLKLFKELAKASSKEAPQVKAMILREIGLCDLHNEKYDQAKKRFVSAISEFNVPSEEMLMKDKKSVTFVLLRDAAVFIEKGEASKAATALRRFKAIEVREKQDFLNSFAKQNKIPPEAMEKVLQDLKAEKGKGEQAQNAKQVIKIINQIDGESELADTLVNRIEEAFRGDDSAAKDKASRLRNSLSGPFAGGVATNPTAPGEDLAASSTILINADKIVKEVEAAKPEKHLTLIKRTKDGSGCKTLPETCGILKELTDIRTNGFGETRLLSLKAGKPQTLDSCETNANVALLIPIDVAVSVTVGGETEEVEPLSAIVVDHCLPGNVLAEQPAKVLWAQAWHPQYASLERTTEIRSRGKKWGLSEDEIKEVTKLVNNAAKKEWESAVSVWLEGAAAQTAHERWAAKMEATKEAAEEAKRAKEESDMAADEERKRGLEALEKKREAKKAEEEAKEKKRKELEQRRRDEEAKKDPWLRDPVVIAAKEKLEELKEARRDANAKLEFDLTTSLTKEISAQERAVEKLIKKAKKAHKKGKTLADEKPSSKGSEAESDESATSGSGGEDEVAKLKAELKEVEAAKAKAAAAEDFAEAKKLKKRQTELTEKLNKLEL